MPMAVSLAVRLQKRARKSLQWLGGWLRARCLLPLYVLTGTPIRDVSRFQRRIAFIERWEYSQNGEDGILEAIVAKIGTTNRFVVEFGVEDGMQCNARYLMKHKGWKGLLMDGQDPRPGSAVKKEFITAENVEALFAKYGVPEHFDLLSIDVDGNDFWIWKAITRFRPRAVIMEYNACIPALPARTIPYQPDFVWDKTDYYGASLGALERLGREKGYTLIATDRHGVNAFFVLNDLAKHFGHRSLEEIYRPAAFKGKAGNAHPRDPLKRPWVDIVS